MKKPVKLHSCSVFEGALASLKKTIEKQKIDVQASGIKLDSVTAKMEPLVIGMICVVARQARHN